VARPCRKLFAWRAGEPMSSQMQSDAAKDHTANRNGFVMAR
jgi:hypothetical protein